MLTDLSCKNLKPKAKDYKKFDGGGLFLLVRTNVRKYWRLKYRIAEREKLLALGVYPEISLSKARIKKEENRKKIREGIDPILEKIHIKSDLKEKHDNTSDNDEAGRKAAESAKESLKNREIEIIYPTREFKDFNDMYQVVGKEEVRKVFIQMEEKNNG